MTQGGRSEVNVLGRLCQVRAGLEFHGAAIRHLLRERDRLLRQARGESYSEQRVAITAGVSQRRVRQINR